MAKKATKNPEKMSTISMFLFFCMVVCAALVFIFLTRSADFENKAYKAAYKIHCSENKETCNDNKYDYYIKKNFNDLSKYFKKDPKAMNNFNEAIRYEEYANYSFIAFFVVLLLFIWSSGTEITYDRIHQYDLFNRYRYDPFSRNRSDLFFNPFIRYKYW